MGNMIYYHDLPIKLIVTATNRQHGIGISTLTPAFIVKYAISQAPKDTQENSMYGKGV